jgi:hypothetical protein
MTTNVVMGVVIFAMFWHSVRCPNLTLFCFYTSSKVQHTSHYYYYGWRCSWINSSHTQYLGFQQYFHVQNGLPINMKTRIVKVVKLLKYSQLDQSRTVFILCSLFCRHNIQNRMISPTILLVEININLIA